MGKLWTRIDNIILAKLPYLNSGDVCFYYSVRTPGGYSQSSANSRIDNFKKSPEKYRDNTAVWKYKLAAIDGFADNVCDLLCTDSFQGFIGRYQPAYLTAMPTSKPKSDPYYDTRIEDLCRIVCGSIPGLSFASPFDSKTRITPAHEGGPRNVETIQANLLFDGFFNRPGSVILVDDVLTKGTHFAACKDMILKRYPETPVVGIFLALHKSDYVDWEHIDL